MVRTYTICRYGHLQDSCACSRESWRSVRFACSLTKALSPYLTYRNHRAYSEYFLPHFFDANKNIIQPNDDRWWLVGDEGHTNAPGKLMAFNRRAMVRLVEFRVCFTCRRLLRRSSTA